MWEMRGFEFRLCLSVCLSLSLSLSVGVLVCGPSSAFFFICACCREICLLYCFSLLIGSDWVFFAFFFFFYREGHEFADPMRRNHLFYFEESLGTDNIRWMLSWAQSLFCVYDKLESDLFRSYNSIDSARKNEVGKETGSSCGLESRVSKSSNVFERNWVLLRTGRAVSEGRNVVGGNRV